MVVCIDNGNEMTTYHLNIHVGHIDESHQLVAEHTAATMPVIHGIPVHPSVGRSLGPQRDNRLQNTVLQTCVLQDE